MNRLTTNTCRLLCGLLALAFGTALTAAPKAKRELYVPMDYSTCGYRASEQALPDVGVAVVVAWQEGDCSALIQQAIDRVSLMKADAEGRRGAVLLGEGRYRLDRALRIGTSGVVLRGVGCGKTVLVKHGTDRGALLYMEGQADTTPADTLAFITDTIPAGSTTVSISPLTSHLSPLTPGLRISIFRPCTWEWIDHLGMRDFGGGLDYTGWKPTDVEMHWDRTVTAVRGNEVVLDAPLTMALGPGFGGAFVLSGRHEGELRECGVENLSMESAVNDWNAMDEDHCWDAVFVQQARDCWVRRVTFRHFAGSAVNLQRNTSRITVEDCIATEPVSELGGWRRQVFLTRGQQTLFQRCISRQGIHDFVAGFCAAGPNAFVQCEGEEAKGFSGSIGSWAPGLLFDIVNIDGHDLRFANLEQFQFGTGWNTANSMFWQCTASTIWCYSPDDDNRCSAHGCWGTLTGNAHWTSSNDHVQPRSLFYAQLQQRLDSLKVDKALRPEGFVLPRSTNATSSPTVEQAMALAKESLMEPRLTLEMWMDSIPFTAPVTSALRPMKPEGVRSRSKAHQQVTMTQAHLTTADGLLLTGNEYDIPWWSGRVKDNFAQRDARPAVTRFVPGREGTGWTDRIDSVVAFLHGQGYASLSHHYGLWYDLRRTDHERVRRADGDVWAPFYEQPFSRTGQGTAWDGLSRYDLTRPNQWYWGRLRRFADLAAEHDILLFHHHYFQHNILEAGAHWVDCPWRPVNNVNLQRPTVSPSGLPPALSPSGPSPALSPSSSSPSSPSSSPSPFPEPVPFAGDKRIFIAEQFYNEQDSVLRPLHQQYIRMCLDQMKDQHNAVHLISGEYTGPLHFTRFWLQTIDQWERETGRRPLVALSCTRDAQDSIMDDPRLSTVVDIIDIRYWHYNTQGLWAPRAGRNLAPRQWMRKERVGKTTFAEAYKAVSEMRQRYPDKAVTFFAQQYPQYGWAILMAGGSLPNVPMRPGDGQPYHDDLLRDIPHMNTVEGKGCVALGGTNGYLLYALADTVSIGVESGSYALMAINATTGQVTMQQKKITLGTLFTTGAARPGHLLWLRRR